MIMLGNGDCWDVGWHLPIFLEFSELRKITMNALESVIWRDFCSVSYNRNIKEKNIFVGFVTIPADCQLNLVDKKKKKNIIDFLF